MADNAVALDAFTTFDPRPLKEREEEIFPGKGTALVTLWKTRQFEYTWLRTLTRTYADFHEVIEAALSYALQALSLDGVREGWSDWLNPTGI